MNQRYDDPTAHRIDEPDPAGDDRRARSRAALHADGFRFSEALPTTHHRAGIGGEVRPVEEIARRLMAVHALNLWVLARDMPDERVLGYIDRNELRRAMSADEHAMLTDREVAAQQHGHRMGWSQENMWSLAWALGFDVTPTPTSPLIDDAVVGPMLDFLPSTDGTLDAFLQRVTPRREAEILDREDLFYCAHNAVRSAQVGDPSTVPEGFHPVMNGGAVHERRHALTWMISPGIAWEDTDLST